MDLERPIDRRTALGLLAAVGALPLRGSEAAMVPSDATAGSAETGAEPGATDAGGSGRMPVVFLAHGSPFLLDDATWVRELAGWSAALPRPRAILMVSAHWENQPVTLGATETVPLVYDFYGFPARYYEVTYPAPGAPELAARTRDLLVGSGTTRSVLDAPTRGLDHGAYVPLVAMYPRADVPVLQMSLPTLDAPELFALGRALESLRDEGVLIVGSGFVTHNLRTLDLRPDAPTPAWAADFDAWVTQALETTDVDALVRYRELAPGVRQSLPTHEHFVPLVVASGAAGSDRAVVDFPITGWMAGSFTRRSVQFG